MASGDLLSFPISTFYFDININIHINLLGQDHKLLFQLYHLQFLFIAMHNKGEIESERVY